MNVPFVASKPNGRGLALYICHEILKRLNATIEFLDERDPSLRKSGPGGICNLLVSNTKHASRRLNI